MSTTRFHNLMFVCHGNICRSPMAAMIMSHLLKQAGRTDITVSSTATSTEEIGNPLYPPARSMLVRKGIPLLPHRARQLQAADATHYDLFLGMDDANLNNMRRILGSHACIRKLLDFTDRPRNVADPWYTDDFEQAFNDIQEGCQALLTYINNHQDTLS